MFRNIKTAAVLATGLALAWAAPAPAEAQSIADLYKGRTVTILMGYGFGGTYGKYARLMSKYYAKFIPGNPNIIVQSMPGAGGIKASNYAFQVMPSKGLHFIEPPDMLVISQLLRPKKIKYNAPEFTWLGGTNQTNNIFVLRKDAGIKKWQDMRTKQVIAGNTGPGAASYMIPRLMNVMLGLKIKPISGYKGSRKTILAMEQNEHQGTSFNWLAWYSIVPQWFEKGREFAIPLMQWGRFKDPDLPNVPMMGDVVDKKYKAIVSFIATHGVIGRGLALPPGVPRKLVAPLRAAFAKMVKDPTYIAEAKKQRLRVFPTRGEEIQKMVNDVFKTSDPKMVSMAREMIFGKKK